MFGYRLQTFGLFFKGKRDIFTNITQQKVIPATETRTKRQKRIKAEKCSKDTKIFDLHIEHEQYVFKKTGKKTGCYVYKKEKKRKTVIIR